MMAMLLELAVIAPQPLLDGLGEDLVGRDRIAAIGARLQHYTRIEVHGAVGAKARSFGFQSQVASVATIEVFLDDAVEMPFRFGSERIAHIHVLAGNA